MEEERGIDLELKRMLKEEKDNEGEPATSSDFEEFRCNAFIKAQSVTKLS